MELHNATLTQSEWDLIQKLRMTTEKKLRDDAFRLRLLSVANRYAIFLAEQGQGSSFSTFIDQFGYQEPDGKYMYQKVQEVLDFMNGIDA